MKRLICYGDSNTYGYDAADVFGGRLPSNHRWPDLLAQQLQCEVINCGMNGRTVPRYPRSQETDIRLIERCAPFDFLIILLGTNDILSDREPEETADAMRQFLCVLQRKLPDGEILLCAPPRVSKIGDFYNDWLSELAEAYREVAEERRLRYLNTFDWRIPLAHDGVHFSPEGHSAFAAHLKAALQSMI